MTQLPTLEELSSNTTWNKRYRLMSEIIHNGPEERALIVKALNILATHKDLSFGERKMLDLALNYEERLKEQNQNVIQLKPKCIP